jgi:peptidyl-prolyl cis-trans isomerase C
MKTLVIDHAAKRAASAAGHAHEHEPAPREMARSPERVAMPPVTVNGVAIARKAIAAEVQNFPSRNPGEGWRAATRALVIRELLLQEAARLGVTAEPRADADGRVETGEDAIIRGLVEREVRTPKAEEADLRRFYERNLGRFVAPPLYEAEHILFAARREDEAAFAEALQKARAVRELLAAEPARFAALACELSACPSGKLGGSLGQVGPGDTTPEFEEALAGAEPGSISPPVATRYGVHLIRLAHRIEGRQLPFDAVRDEIAAYLEERVQRQAMRQYASLLIGRADIRGIALDGAASMLVQ